MRDLQKALAEKGYDPGVIDGKWGEDTKRAALAAVAAAPYNPAARPAGFREAAAAFAAAPAVAPAAAAGAQRTSPLGVAAIAAHEGFVPGPYLDSVGVWTVYVGHTRAAGGPDPQQMPKGMPADLDAALAAGLSLFAHDLAKFEADVRRAFAVPLAQHEFDAAVSFHFNTGAIGRASWVRSMNARNKAAAAAEIMNWVKPPEIRGRREAEQRLFRDGVYPDHAMAVFPVDAAGKITWKALRTVPARDVATMAGAGAA